MPIRVVQWTTGNVGRRCLRAIVDNPGLELVGCYAWSDGKVGRDADVRLRRQGLESGPLRFRDCQGVDKVVEGFTIDLLPAG